MDQASIEFVGVVVVHHVTLSNCCNGSQCGYGFFHRCKNVPKATFASIPVLVYELRIKGELKTT